MNYQKFLCDFESKVIVEGFKKEVIKPVRFEVPINNGRLIKTKFGEFVGRSFSSAVFISINYYGLFKLSSEVLDIYNQSKVLFPNIKVIVCPVIYFNSIKLQQIEKICSDILKDDQFKTFKEYIVGLRWA